jgi:phosphoribosylanthranilate isomerase
MKLKICGMKHNTAKVAALQPDYLGFIFYDKSSRHFDDKIPEIEASTKKVGVFVNATLNEVISKVKQHQLNAVQLHGNESPEYCKELKMYCHSERSEESQSKIPSFSGITEIIKVFSIKDDFDFSVLSNYEDACDYFLFDTKGKLPGGNGYTFNWEILKDYPSTKPYFLSGGIGMDSVEKIKEFKKSLASKYCFALDINSKFEIEPGLKNISALEEFKNKICHVERQ